MAGSYTEHFTEVSLYGGTLFPANRAAAVYNTAWLTMEENQRAVFQIAVGVIAQAGTVDFTVQEAQDAAGTGAQAVAGKAITQLTQAGGDGNDVIVVEVRAEEMTVNTGYNHLRGVLTVAGNTAFTAVVPLRIIPTYPPVSTAALTEVITA